MILIAVIVAPVAFVLIMDLLEVLFEPMIWQRRMMKVGWDMCVLTLGLAGGLFADSGILEKLNQEGPYTSIGLLLLSIVISLAVAVVIALLRHTNPATGWRALLSLLLAGCTLILPTYLALLR